MGENSQDRLPRLLALVPWLLQRPGITLAETATHFGISIDQLTSDLYQLVVCGVPGYGPDQLVDIDFYDGERIWVTDPQTLDVPMRLTPDELTAHLIALRFLSQIPGTPSKEELGVLAAKLDRAASESGIASVAALLDVGNALGSGLEQLIAKSLVQGVKIHFEYSAADNSLTHRTVSPVRVFRVDDFLYLEALCDQAEALRLFRLDRIGDMTLLEQSASDLSDVNYEPASQDSESTALGHLTSAPTATLRLSNAALWLAEENWIETDPSDPSMVKVPYLSADWLFRWVLGLGSEVTILDPPEMAERVSQAVTEGLSRLQAHE